jgi:hypothetical protein
MQSTEFTNRRKQDRVGELFDKKLPSVPHQVPFFTHVPPPPSLSSPSPDGLRADAPTPPIDRSSRHGAFKGLV